LEEIIVRRWVGSLAVSTFVSVSEAGILLWKVIYTSTADEYILQLRMNIYFNCGWIYTSTANEYILQLQMKIYFNCRWRYTAIRWGIF